MKYFANCKTLEELKKEYRKLGKLHHPDCGGDEKVMVEINNEYDIMFPKLKNKHMNKDGKIYEKETNETADEFKDIITALMRMQGVTAEVIGSFIWVTGNTKPYKDILKNLGFKWHSKKSCWYKSPDGYRRHGKSQYSMGEIREMYGVQFEGTGQDQTEKLA